MIEKIRSIYGDKNVQPLINPCSIFTELFV